MFLRLSFPAALALGTLTTAPPADAQGLADVVLVERTHQQLVRLSDLDGSGAYDAPGEVSTFYSADGATGSGATLPKAATMLIEGGVPTIYWIDEVTNRLMRGRDTNGNGKIDVSEGNVWRDIGALDGPIIPRGLQVAADGGVWWTAYGGGAQGLFRSEDKNGNGTAQGLGEHSAMVPNGNPITVTTDAGFAVIPPISETTHRFGQGIAPVGSGGIVVWSHASKAAFRFEDLNGDGDVNDFGERRLFLNPTGKHPGLPQSAEWSSGNLPTLEHFYAGQGQSTATSTALGWLQTSGGPVQADFGEGAGQGTPTGWTSLDLWTCRIEDGDEVHYFASSACDIEPAGTNVFGQGLNGLVFRGEDLNGDGDLNDVGEVDLLYDGSHTSTSPEEFHMLVGLEATPGGLYAAEREQDSTDLYCLDSGGSVKTVFSLATWGGTTTPFTLGAAIPVGIAALPVVPSVSWSPPAPVGTPSFGLSLAQVLVVSDVVPAAWQSPRLRWKRDSFPANKVDDAIDSSNDPLFRVVVNYKRPITAADVAAIEALSPQSSVDRVLRYVTTLAASGLNKNEVIELAASDQVAFIEQQRNFGPTSDVSVKSIRAASSPTYSGVNVEDAWGYDGTGVNIAIMDSGIDNLGSGAGVKHVAFPAERFVAGYDTFGTTPETKEIDPDDVGTVGHGTKVATVALASPTGGTLRGVAPGAGYVDVKVFNQVSILDCLADAGEGWIRVAEGLEWIYDNRDVYNIRVINMSMAQCNGATLPGFPFGVIPSDGLDAVCQLVDMAESLGIVVVAAAGNFGPENGYMTSPGAATRAITVAGSWDQETVERSDDTIWLLSSSGPRDDDCDFDCTDELKPEVTAPAHNILCADSDTTNGTASDSGTSLATPHVAGIAALLLQADPTLNPATVKEIIINSAEQFGTPEAVCEQRWNDDWGWGLVDAYEALRRIEETGDKTDVTFPDESPAVTWLSPDITTDPSPPRPAERATVSVEIENKGSKSANNVRVHFGVAITSGGIPEFYDIGTQFVDLLAAGEKKTVSVEWVPDAATHQSLEVEIGYGADTDFTNNVARHSLLLTEDPVVAFQVQNTLTSDAATVEFDVSCTNQAGGTAGCKYLSGWDVEVTPETAQLAGEDGPLQVSLTADAPEGSSDGSEVTANVGALIGNDLMGGVSLRAIHRDCNGNGQHDYYDLEQSVSSDVNLDRIPDECPLTCGVRRYGLDVGGANSLALVAEGTPGVGEQVDIITRYAPPNVFVFLTLGGSFLEFPYKGGKLLIGPPFLTFTLAADDCGVASFPLIIPPDPTLEGAALHFQSEAWPDPTKPRMSALSNGLRMIICP